MAWATTSGASSAAVSHHIMETHRLYSYRLKLDALADARREAEVTQKHLESAKALGATPELTEEYTGVIKQSWGLSKWLKAKLAEKQADAEVASKDQMVGRVAFCWMLLSRTPRSSCGRGVCAQRSK